MAIGPFGSMAAPAARCGCGRTPGLRGGDAVAPGWPGVRILGRPVHACARSSLRNARLRLGILGHALHPSWWTVLAALASTNPDPPAWPARSHWRSSRSVPEPGGRRTRGTYKDVERYLKQVKMLW